MTASRNLLAPGSEMPADTPSRADLFAEWLEAEGNDEWETYFDDTAHERMAQTAQDHEQEWYEDWLTEEAPDLFEAWLRERAEDPA